VKVTFVCSGNICRSPSAEAVLRAMLVERGLDDRVEVDSFGTGSWHVGDPADPRAMGALAARGYSLNHTARTIDAYEISERDLVIAMDRGHEEELREMAATAEDADKIRLLRSFDPAAGPGDLDVPDPYYGGRDGFERVLDIIEAGCAGLADHISESLAS